MFTSFQQLSDSVIDGSRVLRRNTFEYSDLSTLGCLINLNALLELRLHVAQGFIDDHSDFQH